MGPRSCNDISARDLEARMKKQLAMGKPTLSSHFLMSSQVPYAQSLCFFLVPLGHTGRWGHRVAAPGMGPRSVNDISARDLEARMKKQLAMGELTLPLNLLMRFWILYTQLISFLFLIPLGHTGRWGHKLAEPGMGPRSFNDISARDLEARMEKQLAMGKPTLSPHFLMSSQVPYAQSLCFFLVPLGHTGRWGHRVAAPGMGPREFDDISSREYDDLVARNTIGDLY